MNKDKSRIAKTPEEDPRGDSQIMGVALGDPEESDLFTETEDGYELDATPNDELRELVDEWLHNGYDERHPNSDVAHTINKARAKDLENLIEEYTDE